MEMTRSADQNQLAASRINGPAVRLLASGREFFDVLTAEIGSAQNDIHFQSYILKWDNTGKQVVRALAAASKRGVKVRLLLDAFGSHEIDEKVLRRELGPGVELRFFGPLFSNGRFHMGRRLHQKVVVFDSRKAIVGGINISDAYLGDLEVRPWLDFAVFTEGEPADTLWRHCHRIWNGGLDTKEKKGRYGNPKPLNKAGTRVRPVRNDFLRNKHEIAATYRRAFRTAKHSIDMISGYFLPGGRVRRLIKRANRRGVRIRIVVSEKSDVLLARLAREYLYAWLIRNGVELYEYRPSNVHGKVLSLDGKLTSIGSYDLNNLSTYSNIELNVNVVDEGFNSIFTGNFEKIIREDCNRVTAETVQKRGGLLRMFLCWSAYRITKTLFGISYLVAGEAETG